MMNNFYATPTDAEEAFYRAFENSDLDNMMSVWLDAEYVECIHPMSHRLNGLTEIRDAWVEIFHVTSDIKCETLEKRRIEHNGLAVHIVNENIIMDEGKRMVSILATNIYEHTEQGWRMILHHASPAPKEFNDSDNPPPPCTRMCIRRPCGAVLFYYPLNYPYPLYILYSRAVWPD